MFFFPFCLYSSNEIYTNAFKIIWEENMMDKDIYIHLQKRKKNILFVFYDISIEKISL